MELDSTLLGTHGPWVAMGAAALLGLTGSLHCMLMCGPLACAVQPADKKPSRLGVAAAYQGARWTSYLVLGAVLGAVGSSVGRLFSFPVQRYLPWVLAAAFVAAALELGRFLPRIPGSAWVTARLGRWSARFSPPARAAAIGAVTGLLPCGLLYGVFAVSASSGSALWGAGIAGAFALGGLPALLAMQLHTGLWLKLGKRGSFVMRRVLPLAAAVVLVVRTLQSATPETSCH